MTLEIRTVRALKDNYCYLVYASGSTLAAVVDPSEAAPITKALRDLGLELGLILNTHHHHDHVGGNLELQTKWKCPIYCSQRDFERIPGATKGFSDGDTFEFDGVRFSVLAIPGHTEGQIAYHTGDALFVGDTVFEMGCGRLFEGTPAQMFDSLARLQTFADETRLFVGHEYTETNARFAKLVDPENLEIDQRLSEVREQLHRAGFANAPTVGTEKAVNPFFQARSAEEFARLRERRNSFQ